jgi:hypothetical protein
VRRTEHVEACHKRLHRAGWSIGEVGTSSGRTSAFISPG